MTDKSKTKGWTPERRRKQAQTIRKNKPWEKSTGPKTQKGKDICALNALKHGEYSKVLANYHLAISLNAKFIKQMEIACLLDKRQMKRLNKLKEVRLRTIT